jgi:starch-binding outer membrane protein, SusD/RagB family
MKNNIKNIIYLILLLAIIGNYSCNEEFLNVQPKGTASGDILKTERGVESLLTGAYHALIRQGGRWEEEGPTNWIFGECSSDNMYKGTISCDYHVEDIETYSADASSTMTPIRWTQDFDGVARANDVLNFLWDVQEGDSPIPESRAKEIEAEAKFIRAWFHFEAQKVWEKIPYIKTSREMDGKSPEEIPNDSPKWEDIENDLQFCIDNLPETPTKGEIGRINKYTAMGVKANVHMFQMEFGEAKPILDALINSGKFGLVQNYYDNFEIDTENNIESIFEVQCSVGDGTYGANTPHFHQPIFMTRGPAARGWGFYQPSQNLFEAFQTTDEGLPVLDPEDRDQLACDMRVEHYEEFYPTDHLLDPRVDYTMGRRGIPYLDWGVYGGKSWVRDQDNGGPYESKKFMHYKSDEPANTDPGGHHNARNFRVIRYAHVLLWRAEIAVEDGELDYARNLVNQVRNRAKNSEYVMGRCTRYVMDVQPDESEINWDEPAANYYIEPYPIGAEAFLTKEEARKAVRMEHRLEFASEGMRYYDLRRWGIANEVLNKYIIDDQRVRPNFMKGAIYDPERNDYWPLPQNQLDVQVGVLEQDPAYK